MLTFNSVTCFASPPRRSISQNCVFSFAFCLPDRNEIHLLSGLHFGCVSSSSEYVSCTEPLPSVAVIQISSSYLSSAVSASESIYTTHFPSGDTSGPSTYFTLYTSEGLRGIWPKAA